MISHLPAETKGKVRRARGCRGRKDWREEEHGFH